MLDYVIRVNKKYHPQTLLEECKYEIKKNKMEYLINDDLDSNSSEYAYNIKKIALFCQPYKKKQRLKNLKIA